MNRILGGWLVFAVVILMVAPWVNHFGIEVVNIQLHDTYFVIAPLHFLAVILLVPWFAGILCVGLHRLSVWNRLLAWVILLGNAVIVSFCILLLSFALWPAFTHSYSIDEGNSPSGTLVLLGIVFCLAAILCLQGILFVRIVRGMARR